ncbi:MAG: hypothetical protein IKT01_04470 [Eubacteriaceae bacterium]|nr:hypothetical protein [Eubacteriaceae bacterium]
MDTDNLDDCGNGLNEHEHDHDHEHEHEHEHDHDHEHEHEHGPISVDTHETSIVGAYKLRIPGSKDEAEAILDERMRLVAKEVTELGGIIGHIKAVLTEQGRNVMISITEDESNKRYFDGDSCNADGVAIVFLIKPEQLLDILNKCFGDIVRED